jgi:hypothetical protein
MRDERYFVGLTEQGISFMSFAWDVTLPLQLNLCVDFEVSLRRCITAKGQMPKLSVLVPEDTW